MLKSYLSAEAARPIFINVLDNLLDRNNATAAIKLLDASIKNPSFELLQLKLYVEYSKNKIIAPVRLLLSEGFMTEELIKSNLGSEAPLCIKTELKNIFLEGIEKLVYDGWMDAAKESVNIALHYLGMDFKIITDKVLKVEGSLRDNGWTRGADDAHDLYTSVKTQEFLAEGKNTDLAPTKLSAVQLRLI
jgi:hypothetical protein